jgi:hypothetical protein
LEAHIQGKALVFGEVLSGETRLFPDNIVPFPYCRWGSLIPVMRSFIRSNASGCIIIGFPLLILISVFIPLFLMKIGFSIVPFFLISKQLLLPLYYTHLTTIDIAM